MTDHVDESAARERLERERARVGELIAELRSEGLDEEQADAVRRPDALRPAPGRPGRRRCSSARRISRSSKRSRCDLAEIEAALQRLDDGTYGVDEVTGEPIDPERLDALPTARTNIPPSDGRDRPAAAVRLGARGRGRSRDEFELAPDAPLDGCSATRSSATANVRARAGTARVWVNGDEPPAAARPRCTTTTRSQCCRRSAAAPARDRRDRIGSVSVRRWCASTSVLARTARAPRGRRSRTADPAVGGRGRVGSARERRRPRHRRGEGRQPGDRRVRRRADALLSSCTDEQASSQRSIATLTAQQHAPRHARPPAGRRGVQARLARHRRRSRQRFRHPRRRAPRHDARRRQRPRRRGDRAARQR